MKLKNLPRIILSLYIRFKLIVIPEKIFPHLPKIKKRFPPFPGELCKGCREPFTRIIAIDTGEGWDMFWECKNDCGEGKEVVGWFPFVFGWASYKDMEKIGIETHF